MRWTLSDQLASTKRLGRFGAALCLLDQAMQHCPHACVCSSQISLCVASTAHRVLRIRVFIPSAPVPELNLSNL